MGLVQEFSKNGKCHTITPCCREYHLSYRKSHRKPCIICNKKIVTTGAQRSDSHLSSQHFGRPRWADHEVKKSRPSWSTW